MFGTSFSYERERERPVFVTQAPISKLIELRDFLSNDARHYVAAAAIASISEVAETKTTRAHTLVVLFDGRKLKVRDTAASIERSHASAAWAWQSLRS